MKKQFPLFCPFFFLFQFSPSAPPQAPAVPAVSTEQPSSPPHQPEPPAVLDATQEQTTPATIPAKNTQPSTPSTPSTPASPTPAPEPALITTKVIVFHGIQGIFFIMYKEMVDMSNEEKKLRSELETISSKIYELRLIIDESTDPGTKKELQQKMKLLQYQALFYIELLENMESRTV